MTQSDVQHNSDEALKKLQELSFNAPMMVHDEIRFRKMLLGLPVLLIYCNPDVHGRQTYEKILAAVG